MPSPAPNGVIGPGLDGPEVTLSNPGRRAAAVVLGLLLVFATVLHVGHVVRYRTISPVDELQHLDYLIRAPRGDIVGAGELFLQESARIQTCARLDEGFDVNIPPCVTDSSVELDVVAFQESGYNTAFIHPPTYYLVGGVVARVIDAAVPGDQSLLTTGRLAALLWGLAGVVFMWLLLAELRAGLLARAALIVAVVSAPQVWHATATINPDGTAVAFGAALLWAVLRWERRGTGAWIPVVLAALAAAVKVTDLVAVAVVVLYLLFAQVSGGWRWRSERDPEPGSVTVLRWWRTVAPRLRLVAGMLVAAGAVSFVWLLAQRLLEEVPPDQIPMVARFTIDQFPYTELAVSWQQTVSPLRGAYLAPFLRTQAMAVTSGMVDLALMVGAVAGAVLAGVATRARRLAVAALVLAVSLGPLLVVFNAAVQGIYVVIPPRYGLALVPALAAAALPVVQRRSGLVVATAVAGLAGTAALAALAFPATA